MNKMPSNKACTYLQRNGETAIPIVSFVGASNAGKTTLLEKVVRELKLKGYRVAVIKHSHHDFDIDRTGKDTWRLAQAGSDIVVISSPHKIAFIERVEAEPTLAQIEALFVGKVDIVLTEGYKNDNAAKILVLNTEEGQEQICRGEEILATVSAHSSAMGISQFDSNDVASIVNLLREQINDNSPDKCGDIPKAASGYRRNRSSVRTEVD